MSGLGAKHKRSDTSAPHRITNGVSSYQLGSELGRGGFAVVYQALNVDTGEFVAVKEFPLGKINDQSLADIEMEIDLMKRLDHENIVKYVDSIRTDFHLYIVLEFMENGSLASICSKYGNLSESLVAIYMTQVLRGLNYLHGQGVLHRDIKGPNILTAKGGVVKLADFGVAITNRGDGEANDADAVGTPYWMAPEIIEMSKPTTACDLWSVGCTIIELLTGNPPYFDMAPMAALFKIVQDDYPPLPSGISPALRSFLLACFKKEPMLRPSAAELLDHPWLKSSSIHIDNMSTDARFSTSEAADDSGAQQSVVSTLKAFAASAKQVPPSAADRVKKRPGASVLAAGSRPAAGQPKAQPKPVPPPQVDSGDADFDDVVVSTMIVSKNKPGDAQGKMPPQQFAATPATTAAASNANQARPGPAGRPQAKASRPGGKSGGVVQAKQSPVAAASDDNFDADFDVGPELPVAAAKKVVPKPVASSSKYADDADDNWDDVGGDISSTKAVAKPAASKPVKQLPGDVSKPRVVVNQQLSMIDKYKDRDDDDGGFIGDLPKKQDAMSPTSSVAKQKHDRQMASFTTMDDDEDLFASTPKNASSNDGDVDFADEFFDESDMVFNVEEDIKETNSNKIAEKFVKMAVPRTSEQDIKNICAEIINLLNTKGQSDHFVCKHGVISLLELFEVQMPLAFPEILGVLQRFIDDNDRAQSQLCLTGVVPHVLGLVTLDYRAIPPALLLRIKMQAAGIMHTMCMSESQSPSSSSTKTDTFRPDASISKLPLQMFVGGGGITVFISLLAYSSSMLDNPDSQKLVGIGTDCSLCLFGLQSRVADYCRIFTKLGGLPHLCNSLSGWLKLATQSTVSTQKNFCLGLAVKSSETLYNLSKGSLAVIGKICDKETLKNICGFIRNCVATVSGLSSDKIDEKQKIFLIVEWLLKFIKALSGKAVAQQSLAETGVVTVLVSLLASPIAESVKVKSQIMLSLFDLCRIYSQNQKEALEAGIFPYLQRMCNDVHMKQVAMDVMCDIVKAPNSSTYLFQFNAMQSFTSMLALENWAQRGFSAILLWVNKDLEHAGQLLTKPETLHRIVQFLCKSQDKKSVKTMLNWFEPIVTRSVNIARALCLSSMFVGRILIILEDNEVETAIKRNMISILRHFHSSHINPRRMVLDFDLYQIIRRVAEQEGQIIVQTEALQFLKEIQVILSTDKVN